MNRRGFFRMLPAAPIAASTAVTAAMVAPKVEAAPLVLPRIEPGSPARSAVFNEVFKAIEDAFNRNWPGTA